MSKLKNENRIFEVLNEVNLWDKRNQKVSGYSQGMKQRLGIAQTQLHQPSLIILDEPSNGLDPQGQADMRDLILIEYAEFRFRLHQRDANYHYHIKSYSKRNRKNC